ncbi:hypothetical protein BGZ83_005134 [Gryganskiella cystojenkinii]|nr:hypothetical protein BGZ83_005134 [Gryganskiella cystojenkinii]
MAELGINPPMRTPLQDIRNHNILRPNNGSTLQGLTQKPVQRVAPTIIIDEKEYQRSRLALQQRPHAALNVLSSKSQQPLNLKVRMPQPTYPEAKKLESVLRANNSNSNANQEKTSVAANPLQQQQSQQTASRPDPADITRQWLQMLPKCRFYFDNVDPNIVTKMSKVLVANHASVSMFFSSDVTHLITTRSIPKKEDHARIRLQAQEQSQNAQQQAAVSAPMVKPSLKLPGPPVAAPETSVIIKAIGFNMKIWHLDKVKKLMEPLMGNPLVPNESKNLQDLLRHEKAYGLTTTQKDESGRANYHVFRGPYVLIEDTTGKHRTILAYEYDVGKVTSNGKLPYPKFHLQPTERSPFTYVKIKAPAKEEPHGVPEKQDVEPSAVAGETPEGPLVHDAHRPPSAVASGIVNSVTSHVVSTTSAMGKALAGQGPHGTQNAVLEQLGKRVLTAPKVGDTIAAPTVPPPPVVTAQELKKGEFARPADIVRSNNADIKGTRLFEKIEQKNGQTIPITVVATTTEPAETAKPAHPAGPAGPAGTAEPAGPAAPVGPAETAEPALAPAMDEARLEQLKALAPGVPSEQRKKGYCENCHGFFDDMNRHIASQAHRIYSHDSSKFVHLDKFLVRLSRKPRKESTIESSIATQEQLVASRIKSTKSLESTEQSMPTAPMKTPKEADEGIVNVESLAPIAKKRQSFDTSGQVKQAELQPSSKQDQARTRKQQEKEKQTMSEKTINKMGEKAQEESKAKSVAQSHPQDTFAPHVPTSSVESIEGTVVSKTVPPTIAAKPKKSRELVIEDPFQEDGSEPAKMPSFFTKRMFGSQLRLPLSDNLTSQIETDVTQPDDRFLDGSIADSNATEPVVPIHLAMSMTSTLTDGPEPVCKSLDRERNYALDADGSSDSDKDDADDVVALVKSPSAGRGSFPRSQAASLHYSHASVNQTPRSTMQETLKRKLDQAYADERTSQKTRGFASPMVHTPRPKPAVFDENLRSRLLSQTPTTENTLQNSQNQPSLRPVSWPATPRYLNDYSPALVPTQSSPAQLLPVTSPIVADRYQACGPGDTSDTLPLNSNGGGGCASSGPDLGLRYANMSIADYDESDSQPPYPDTPLKQKVARMNSQKQQQLHGTEISLPPVLGFNPLPYPIRTNQNTGSGVFGYGEDHWAKTSASTTTTTMSTTLTGRDTTFSHPTSPTSPERPESVLSRSPARSAYLDHSQTTTPTRSPSSVRTHHPIPVMTRAEQELERCYHHYHGHRLPEAGSQKKMRGSTSLLEEFEEYGEGCMVFIE